MDVRDATDQARDNARAAQAADDIADRGWARIEHFLDPADRTALANAVRASSLREARTGVASGEQVRSDVRADAIAWIDHATASSPIARWHARMEAFGVSLAAALRLPAPVFDAHMTRYAPRTFYRAHVDAADDGSRRLLSAICYLGDRWKAAHGGCLRLAARPGASCRADDAIRLEPLGGSLVLFTSRDLEHEVETTHVERLSLTGWYLRASA